MTNAESAKIGNMPGSLGKGKLLVKLQAIRRNGNGGVFLLI
jgi:hypothetical protein